MRWPSAREKFVLCLAVGVALAAGAGFFLRRAEKNINARYQMTGALRVKKYVPQDRLITDDMVEEVEVPVTFLQPMALQARKDLRDGSGRLYLKTRIGILKGEQLTRSKLYNEETLLGLPWALQPGHTALALQLGLDKAVAGLLQPGDAVHVFCTMERQAEWPRTETRLLFANVRVLAVQNRVWDPSGARTEKTTQELAGEPILVTLELSPSQAAKAVLAYEKGRIALALVSSRGEAAEKKIAVNLTQLGTP